MYHSFQLAAVLGNRDIGVTENASSQIQDGNCVFELGPVYGAGNR